METDRSKGKGRGGARKGDRSETHTTISVYREIAKMCVAVADDEGVSVAELTDPLLRGPLQAKYRRILERELKGLGPGA